jgi:hypothetical protein
MLKLDLRPGEGFEVENGRVVVRVESKSGQSTRLSIEAAKEIPIRRLEGVPSPAQLARQGLTRAA